MSLGAKPLPQLEESLGYHPLTSCSSNTETGGIPLEFPVFELPVLPAARLKHKPEDSRSRSSGKKNAPHAKPKVQDLWSKAPKIFDISISASGDILYCWARGDTKSCLMSWVVGDAMVRPSLLSAAAYSFVSSLHSRAARQRASRSLLLTKRSSPARATTGAYYSHTRQMQGASSPPPKAGSSSLATSTVS